MLKERVRSIFRNRLLQAALVTVALMAIAATVVWAMNIGTYDQCANNDASAPPGTGYPDPDPGCHWINGNLNGNNSYYPEGSATTQRVWLTGLEPGSVHTITLRYGTTKGGKHAYDFLTRYDWFNHFIVESDLCQGITPCVGVAQTYLDIAPDLDPTHPPVTTYENLVDVAQNREFVMRGVLPGSGLVTRGPMVVSGNYTGDSETEIDVQFTVDNTMCATPTSCGVALWFAAHVARQLDWGAGTGAGSIPGSPYHVMLAAFDGASIGERDNQMQASALTVALDSFTAAVQGNGVALAWETVSEVDTAGFNVYRAESAAGPWTRVNAALIAAAAPGATAGHAYAWIDTSAAAGTTYWYQLEEVALLSGTAVLYTPIMVGQAEPNSVAVVGLSASALNAAAPLGALGVALLSGFALARRRR